MTKIRISAPALYKNPTVIRTDLPLLVICLALSAKKKLKPKGSEVKAEGPGFDVLPPLRGLGGQPLVLAVWASRTPLSKGT